jgi:hypothetical protein
MNSKDTEDARDSLFQSALGASAITVGSAIEGESRAVYVGVAGNLVVIMANGQTVTFENMPVGIHPISIVKVLNTSTAASLVALY